MRKALAVSLVLAAAPVGSLAQAAPPNAQCTLTAPESGCFVDEVLVVKGDELTMTFPSDAMPAMTVPLVNCYHRNTAAGGETTPRDNCFIGLRDDYPGYEGLERAVLKALALSKGQPASELQWDQIVVFGADISVNETTPMTTATQHGPLFYRPRGAGTVEKVNEVLGLGLPLAPRDPTKPYVGIIAAGTTKDLGTTTNTPLGKAFGPAADAVYGACDLGYSTCFPGLMNYFDALVQTTGMLYGPYLRAVTAYPATKSGILAAADPKLGTGGELGAGPDVRIWQSFLDTRGSIFGGNTWRDQGNGTWETAMPSAFQGVSAPLEGRQRLRFRPLDLYLLGFVPDNELEDVPSFVGLQPNALAEPKGVAAFSASVGPGMGVVAGGIAFRATPGQISVSNILGGAGRVPDASSAPQAIKQLWVVVTKPEANWADGKTDWPAQKAEILAVARARRHFNRYFHNLAAYRGRVHTTFEGDVDDSGYFEFGDRLDDPKDWVGQGASIAIPGPELVPNTNGRMLTVARIDAGAGGQIVFRDTSHKIRISGAQDLPLPNNYLTLRMRLPNNPGGERLVATVTLSCDNGPIAYQVPGGDQAALIPDGRFHNYTVALTAQPAFAAATCTGISVSPTSGREAAGIELDFVKIGGGSATEVADVDLDCAGAVKGDGWPAIDDNCPLLFNPDQADGNNDGIGDACEDFDGDGARNLCDNCPTTTNSSQRDANGNKLGDACDGSQTSDCFFQSNAIAGAGARPSALIFASLGFVGLALARLIRRRRRRD